MLRAQVSKYRVGFHHAKKLAMILHSESRIVSECGQSSVGLSHE
jgi:hypothetical protein